MIECGGDVAGDVVLERKRVHDIAVEPLRPQMRVGFSVNQLRIYAELLAAASHTALEHIAHSQFVTDLPYVNRSVSIGERGRPRDHEGIFDVRQIGGQILVIPSAKCCCSRSPPRLTNGNTTIDRGGRCNMPPLTIVWLIAGASDSKRVTGRTKR